MLEELFKLTEAEQEYRELYFKYPQVHQNPPKTLEQLMENGRKYPDYKETFDKYFKDCPRSGSYITENLFAPKEDVALLMHSRYVPGFIHYHEFFEITYVLNGKYRNFVNGKLMELEKGDVCILAPNVHHCPITHLDEDVVCNILVRSSTFDRMFFYLMKGNAILSTFFSRALSIPNGGSYLTFSTKNDKEVEAILLTMLSEYRKRELYYAPMINKLMSAMFIMLLRNHSTTMNTAFSDHLNFSQKITTILQYLRDNIETVTLPKLAKKFSYSERQLSRLLLKYTGKTFTTLLQELRLQRACMLLKDSAIPIHEIILKCGYKNQNHFYQKFKAYCGKTPAQYRRDIILNSELGMRNYELN